MTKKQSHKPSKTSRRRPEVEADPDCRDIDQDAFQLWVNAQLRKLYDPVLDEPVPEDLLKLIKQHRNNQK